MYIPLDNLYDWISGVAHDTLIYRFFPHGSKKLEDLKQNDTAGSTQTWTQSMSTVPVICYDQEPLDYSAYMLDWEELQNFCIQHRGHRPDYHGRSPEYWKHRANLNLSALVDVTVSDRHVLLHTEKRSPELEKYSQDFVPAYWWSHGLIARDWYRFAQYDQRLYNYPVPTKDFNIYCRATTGTRQYRSEFLDIISGNLVEKSLIGSDEIPSDASATYDAHHYQQCAIDVVLETLFDDPRLYLTEKILRPIACGKPFILASTMGSLEYLREYGFKTFHGILNETYDTITDPHQRLRAIANSMTEFSNLDTTSKLEKITAMASICEFNRQHFFSNTFIDQVVGELKHNLEHARDIVKNQYQLGRNWFAERNTTAPVDRKRFRATNQVPMTEIVALIKECRRRQRVTDPTMLGTITKQPGSSTQ